MNLKYIPYFVVLISIAFMGLIFIQIYWIKNSLELRKSEFNSTVTEALDRVARKVDREEEAKRANPNSFSFKVLTEQSAINGLYNPMQDPFETDFPKDYSERPEDFTVILPEGKRPDIGASDILSDDAKVQMEILEQTGLLSDLPVKSAQVEVQVTPDLEDRVAFPYLDSLMREELRNKGIHLDFSLGVVSNDSVPLLYDMANQSSLADIIASPYRSPLFAWDHGPDKFLKVYFPKRKRYVLSSMLLMLGASALLIIFMMLAFWYTISTILKQKKVSEIKNDFINNMTHELKTPISTISLACEALRDPAMSNLADQRNTFVGMIQDENKRLGVLVENVLRSAMMDREEMRIQIESVNLHEILQTVVRNLAIKVSRSEGKVELDLQATNPMVEGDRVHLTNMVYNLIDNALKYANGKPLIIIRTGNTKKGVDLSFEDNGIGIAKTDQPRVFDKFYRVPKGDVHDVKGFGLGLSYVKTIVDKHFGTIDLKSELNKGTTFIINLPHNYEKED